MTVLVVESEADPASVTLARVLHRLAEWIPRREIIEGHALEAWKEHPDVLFVRTPRLHLHAEPVEQALFSVNLRPDAIVFLSKHKAASGRPSLTVHPVGNPGEARYGGQAGKLSPCAPALQTELLRALFQRVGTRAYPAEVTFEVTHHGPLLTTPACFLELGSSEAQWQDAEGARVVAEALLEVLSKPLPTYPVAVGVGGGHYAPRFTEAALTRRVNFGHMVPTHAAEATENPGALLAEAMRATPGAVGVYGHRKMLERDVWERWNHALKAKSVPWLDSVDWEPLPVSGSPSQA